MWSVIRVDFRGRKFKKKKKYLDGIQVEDGIGEIKGKENQNGITG